MANDSRLFRGEKDLRDEGWQLDGNAFVRDTTRMLPLYEAKMVHHFDSRRGTYKGQTQAQANQGTLPPIDAEQHADPDTLPWPRYWVAEPEVHEALDGRWEHDWLLGWRDIARSVDERTVIATVIPLTAVGHKYPLALTRARPVSGLQANLSALVLDYCARQKISGTSVIFALVKQLPVLAPDIYRGMVPWESSRSLEQWVTERVVELSYTAWDLESYARDLGYDGPPFRWDEGRRAQIRAELDAAYLLLYGLNRGEAEHVLDSFVVLRDREKRDCGEFRTRRLVLAAYDGMTSGEYHSPLDPLPGHSPRHPEQR